MLVVRHSLYRDQTQLQPLNVIMRWIIGLLIALAISLQYQLWFVHDSVVHIWHLHHDITTLASQNQQLIQRNKLLLTHIEQLKYNPVAIEQRAREDLGMIKRDEVYYQL